MLTICNSHPCPLGGVCLSSLQNLILLKQDLPCFATHFCASVTSCHLGIITTTYNNIACQYVFFLDQFSGNFTLYIAVDFIKISTLINGGWVVAEKNRVCLPIKGSSTFTREAQWVLTPTSEAEKIIYVGGGRMIMRTPGIRTSCSAASLFGKLCVILVNCYYLLLTVYVRAVDKWTDGCRCC